jgi:hypothetical protein
MQFPNRTLLTASRFWTLREDNMTETILCEKCKEPFERKVEDRFRTVCKPCYVVAAKERDDKILAALESISTSLEILANRKTEKRPGVIDYAGGPF